jgi:hypothetical protein
MGRPIKTKVSETSAADIAAVVDRVAKKLKSFSQETLYAAAFKSFQKTEDKADETKVELAVVAQVALYVQSGKYTVTNGVYTVVAGKRGRPKKVVEAVAAV